MGCDSLPVLASIISTFSRAGLNVIDRKQFREEEVCPLVIGYWNNLLPIFLIFPIIFFSAFALVALVSAGAAVV